MDRRAFLGSLALVGTQRAAAAQPPPRVSRIGVLTATNPKESRVWQGFFQGLRELGYVEGQNMLIERRSFGDKVDQLPGLAAELAQLPVDVIVTGAAPEPEAARRATSAIPIVTAAHLDLVGSGLVASLAKPGGNVTGLTTIASELRGKQLQLLKEAVPDLRSVAALADPTVPGHARELRNLEMAARSMKLRWHIVEARVPDEIANAFVAAARQRAGAVVGLVSALFFRQRAQVAEQATTHRLPLITQAREIAEAGGLMAYGVDLRENFRRAAGYVDRILKGAKPSDLPVEQPTKFDLVINLKTAKALGLTIAPALLQRADQVIE